MHPLWGRIIAFLVIPAGCLLGAVLGMFTGGMVLLWAMGAGPRISTAVPGALGSLLANALIPAFGWVCALVSIIGFIYAIFHFLEDTGYLARAACLLDPVLGRLGVDGRSAIPLLMGMLCNTVAIAGSRIIDVRRRRVITVTMLPFLPCSGQTGVSFFFAFALFPPTRAVLVVIGVTAVNILLAALAGVVADRLVPGRRNRGTGDGTAFVSPAEFPNGFQWCPQSDGLVRARRRRVHHCVLGLGLGPQLFPLRQRGGKLSSYGRTRSGAFGRLVGARLAVCRGPASAPLWPRRPRRAPWPCFFSVNGGDHQAVVEAVRGAISPAGALAFIVASNLYLPCIATISALRTEFGSWKPVAGLLVVMLAVALSLACVAFRIGNVFFS